MKKILLLFAVFICIFSCKKSETNDTISPSTSYSLDFNNQEKVKNLSERIINGDTIAYNELRYIYYYSGHVSEFLPFSLVMANDYNFPIAYFHAYKEMNLKSRGKPKTDSLANYYLFCAFEKNAEHSKGTIEEKFGKDFKVPNSKKYWISLVAK